MDLADLLIHTESSILDALRAIEHGGCEAVFVEDAGRGVVGIITDGDIRRGLLRGAALDAPVRTVLNPVFKSVEKTTDRNDVLDMMMQLQIRQIPVLDENRRLVAVHLLNDFIGIGDKPNAAVIMAGGKGLRLRPLTEHLPKPLVKVAGRPILERLVTHLVGYGIKKIYLSINYLGHMIEEHFEDGSAFGCSIEYLKEDRELGTGGALSLLPEIPESPLLVLNGDLMTDANMAKILDFHERTGDEATIVAKLYTHTVPYGVVEFAKGRLAGLQEKPSVNAFINAGIYVLNPSVLARVPKDTFFPITGLFEHCLETGLPVSVYILNEDWRDLGNSEELNLARGHLV
jgi:dTDP-glucose pyrophosphorylase/predicted transcriptional regulator